MPAEIETTAFAGAVPWHGLGESVSGDLTPKEMLKAAKLNWTVSKRPMFTPSITGYSIDQYADSGANASDIDKMLVEDYFALVRDSDNKILGPCGKEYIPTQNSQAMDFFKKFTDAGRMKLETAGSLQGGKQVWCLANIGQGFELAGGDKVDGYLLLSSPHIWGKSLVIKFTPIRVVCMNTLVMALKSQGKYSFRMPHIREFDATVAKEAEAALGIAQELLDGFKKASKKLASTKVSDDVAVRYIAELFQDDLILEAFGKNFYKSSEQDQVKSLVDASAPNINASEFKTTANNVLSCVNSQPGADMKSAKGTLWGAFNAVTYFIDHKSGRDRDNAVYSAWFGPKGATKQYAFERATQYANAISG